VATFQAALLLRRGQFAEIPDHLAVAQLAERLRDIHERAEAAIRRNGHDAVG
jgi:hypothetical protein